MQRTMKLMRATVNGTPVTVTEKEGLNLLKTGGDVKDFIFFTETREMTDETFLMYSRAKDKKEESDNE